MQHKPEQEALQSKKDNKIRGRENAVTVAEQASPSSQRGHVRA
jgi:hypothetical protein